MLTQSIGGGISKRPIDSIQETLVKQDFYPLPNPPWDVARIERLLPRDESARAMRVSRNALVKLLFFSLSPLGC